MSCFSKHASAMYEKSQTGRNDNLYLAKLRDTLLPKLISGELRLPESTSAAPQQETAAA